MTVAEPVRKDYARDLIAMFTEVAKSRGTSSCPIILDYMMTVPDTLIPPEHYPVWEMVRDLAGRGSPPTIPTVRRSMVSFDPNYWATLKTDEASIRDVRDALLSDAQRRRYILFHGDLKTMLLDGTPFPKINDAMSNLIDESFAGVREATHLGSVSFMDRMLAVQEGTIPMIETPWTQLNRALGGGLFMGGDLAMSAVLAYSGVGKTRFAQQINNHANAFDHWVLVFAGESNRYSYMQSLATMLAAVPKSEIKKGMSKDVIDDLRKAEKIIQGRHTYVYDTGFDIEVIRAVMSRTAHKLREHKTAGTAPPHAQLLTIVDNIDHAIKGGGEKEWQQLEQAAKGLYNTAQRLDSHVILLAQATKASFLSGYAPGHTDFARASLIASHCANVITLYRPLLQEQRDADDTRAEAKFGLPKTRSGNSDPAIPTTIDDRLGMWL